MITKNVEINTENKYWLQVWELQWHIGHKIKERGIMSLELGKCKHYGQRGSQKHWDVSMIRAEWPRPWKLIDISMTMGKMAPESTETFPWLGAE